MKKTLEFLNYGNKTSILNQIKPERNEITFILNANTIASPIYVVGEEVNLNGKKFLISEYTQVPFTGNIKNMVTKTFIF